MSSTPVPHPPRPRIVGIIGAGAVGLSCAIHLQRAGYAVEILDPREPGEGASLGNAGIIAASEVLPVGRPSMLRQVPGMLLDRTGPLAVSWRYLPSIAPWLLRFMMASRPAEVKRISSALAVLLAGALDAWRDIVRGSDAERLLVARGWLRLYGDQGALRRAMPDIARQRECGVKLDILDAAQIRQVEPALAPVFAGAAYFPEIANVTSPLRMMRALAAAVVRNGGAIRRREVQRIESAEGRPAVVDTTGAATAYDRLIVAAGAWSRRIVRTLGLDVPLDTERGYHVMLPTPRQSLRVPVTVTTPGYSLVQMEDGLRLTTGIEFAGLDAPPDFRRVHRMAAHAAGVLPGLEAEPTSEWLGFRPSMPRSMPVIGALPERPEILLAFGHGHLGLTLGPVTGRLVAALVDGRPPAIDLAPFLPARVLR